MSLRIGYSFWGFLGDVKLGPDGEKLSTPDGNATYSWSIVWEAMKRGHIMMPMMPDRDWPSVKKFGEKEAFHSFSRDKRAAAYDHLFQSDCIHSSSGRGFPDLDVLLLEWRFPIPGRNTPEMRGKPGYQPDLDRQNELIEHYSQTKTKIILWDLDHKLEMPDEFAACPDAIFETSVDPKSSSPFKRTRVEPPICVEDLLQFKTLEQNERQRLVYIGSRYERDDVIDEWIEPASRVFPKQIEFYGKWDGEAIERWPLVSFMPRITTQDFWGTYGRATAVPLLGKRSYMETGFITPRPWEALMFGSLPIGLKGHLGIDQYCLDVALSPEHLCEIVDEYSRMSLEERHRERMMLAEKLEFMDARHFVDRIEAVC